MIEERHKKLFMILKTCQICRICGMWHAKCVCVAMRRPQLWQLLRRCLLLPLLLGLFLFFFLPFLSNTAENVVILRSLRFVSFLIYSMAGSMWVHPLLVCECHSFAHMPQCTTTTTWPKVLGHIKTKTKAQAEADQVTFLLTLLQLQRKVENKKKMEQKSFLARKIKQQKIKKKRRKATENKMRQSWSCC